MTRDEIIRMAREAGFTVDEADFITAPKSVRMGFQLEIERFAALVAEAAKAEEREACANVFARFAALVAAAEREACARVVEDVEPSPNPIINMANRLAAAAIRARGEKR